MAEPKVRFRQDDGTPYPALRNAAMGDYYTERNERGEKGLPMLTVSIHSGISDGELDEEELGKRVNRSADVSLYKKAVKGDLVFNMMRAWQGAVGSTKSTGMVSPAYIVASPNKEIDPTFMNYYVQTKTIINRFNRLSYGALDFRKRLYWDSFIAAEVNIPVIKEQQKIADFLSSVDEVIVASEQEVANLETQKKAVMKKIFSQEVRFKREDGSDFPEWEEDYVGNRCKIQTGKSNTQDAIEDGEYPFYVRSPLIYRSNRYLFDTEAVITVGDGVGTGKVYHYVNGKFDLHQRAYAMTDFIGMTGKYFYCYFSAYFYERVRAMTAKTSVDSVRYDMIDKMKIKIPCIEEQHLIADFLSNFDEAIAAAKKELEHWKELKKGLLQQMFV